MSRVEQARQALAQVHDPEIPAVTIEDLGILRDVAEQDGRLVVTLTPTYSGCPAMQEIEADVRAALSAYDVEVRTVLSPAWTTDWMTDRGREALQRSGIAPPQRRVDGPVLVTLSTRPRCPHCGSGDSEELSRFGSTSCKALWRCRSCREPFDLFKDH